MNFLYVIDTPECRVLQEKIFNGNIVCDVVGIKKHEMKTLKDELKLEKLDFPIFEDDDGNVFQNVFVVNKEISKIMKKK